MGAVASHELKLLNSLSSVELCAQLLLFMAEQVGMVVTSKDIPSSEHRHAWGLCDFPQDECYYYGTLKQGVTTSFLCLSNSLYNLSFHLMLNK